jgi:predicted nucleic acid-binding protein
MKVFADTFFFLALLDSRDAAHEEAKRQARRGWQRIYTTDYVLVELGNALSAPTDRIDCLSLVSMIRQSPVHEVVPASAALFAAGWKLFGERPDKHWSITDCLSMTVMRELSITEVLTADHHFTQAGFHALLISGAES